MGGLFKAPKPQAPPPAPSPEPAAPVLAGAEAAETASREAQIRAADRARRSLSATIATSPRGVLDPAPAFATRKTLLGE